jgi:hypothetical protein
MRGTITSVRESWPVRTKFRVLDGEWEGNVGSVVGYDSRAWEGTTNVRATLVGRNRVVLVDSLVMEKIP